MPFMRRLITGGLLALALAERAGGRPVSEQADHRHRAVCGRRTDRRGHPPGRRPHVAHARPDARGREHRRRRRDHRHDARRPGAAGRLHHRGRQHGHAVGGAGALSEPQIRSGQELRAGRHRQLHAAGDRGQEGHGGGEPEGVHRLPQGQPCEAELRPCRRRLDLARVGPRLQFEVRLQAEPGALSRHRAGDPGPRRRPDRLHGRPVAQRHPADQGRHHQGLCHRGAGAAVEPAGRADHQGSRRRFHLQRLERDGRAQGHAARHRRQARGRAQQGARRPGGAGALCRARQLGAQGRRPRPRRLAEAGRERGRPHHPGHQGRGRRRRSERCSAHDGNARSLTVARRRAGPLRSATRCRCARTRPCSTWSPGCSATSMPRCPIASPAASACAAPAP